MTTRFVPLAVLPAEQGVHTLQMHHITWTGYAYALAQRANLTPEEAARLFMQAMTPYVVANSSADAAVLEQQARQAAEMMALLHGHANVLLEQTGEVWSLRTTLTELKEGLAIWGIPLEFFARWMGEQARLVGESKGIDYQTWLDGKTLYMQLALRKVQ